MIPFVSLNWILDRLSFHREKSEYEMPLFASDNFKDPGVY